MRMGYETFGLAPGLEEFLAVARHEHITRAAEELGINQPTLSRAIARLSAEVGVPLVQRDGRGVTLTRSGRQLAERAERALAELLTGLRTVRAEADPDAGTAVLGFLHSMGPSVVPDLLREFGAARPRVVIRLVHESTDELVRQVSDGRVDLCIAAPVPQRLPAHLRSRELSEQPLVLLVPSGHRLVRSAPILLRELRDEALIALNPAYGLRELTDRLLRRARVRAAYVFESQDIATTGGLVAAGLGLALLPAGSGQEGTVELPLADSGATRTISLVWRQDRPATAPVRDLRRHIIEAAPSLLSTDRRACGESTAAP